jgi:hypothetical protein
MKCTAKMGSGVVVYRLSLINDNSGIRKFMEGGSMNTQTVW